MQDKINQLTKKINTYQGNIDHFKHTFTGRKGGITALFKEVGACPSHQRQKMGIALNNLKKLAQEKLAHLTKEKSTSKDQNSPIDVTLPPRNTTLGTIHPLRSMTRKIVHSLTSIGFQVAQGPEISDDFHNFSALNFPPDHPARAMQDTFFLSKDKQSLLRTHTSSVQVEIMSKGKPPFRVVVPGRVFRNEAISARTHCLFHQVEAFYVNKNVSVADLKGVLLHLIQSIFGKERTLRLRPSYFPFTEPSVEVDMSCAFCAQKGCNICKQSGWVEVLGAGMIDPNVLDASGIDQTLYSGFALGIGIERMAMLYYQIDDIRLFTQNDTRFLKQFSTLH